ncbi:MAG: hypothetical protein ABIJ56_06465 [Pseudomonadota bacterium]
MAAKHASRAASAALAGTLFMLLLAAGCASTDTEGDFSVDTTGDETVDFVSDTDGDQGDIAPECGSDMDCNDGIACTVDHCEDGACVNDPCEDCCPDGLTCIPDYGCGTAPKPCETDEECKDDIACTLDRCRDETFCENIPQNGLCDEGEICLAALGCIPKPPDECEEDEDCDMANPCLGEWYCDAEFGCQFLSVLDCGDDDACTDDGCDPETGDCVHPVRDADEDGHGDIDCEGGDDCDDGDPDVYPGAPELCNEKDDDCDELVDEGCCDEGAECETECGSTGAIDCPPDGGEGECVPPPEACNGDDDDCDDLVDEDFECTPPDSTEECETECESAGTRECSDACEWGECVPPDEECNGLDDDCIEGPDNGFACVLGSFRTCTTGCSSTGTRECIGGCVWDSCVPPEEVCNGADDDCDTLCDDGDAFNCCAGATRDCRLLDFYAGTAVCTPDCMDWNISACTNCGNGEIDEGEQCDDEDFGDDDCTTLGLGFTGGELGCDAACRFDVSDCHKCGNGVVDDGEECDHPDYGDPALTCEDIDDFMGGDLACYPDCTLDTTGCHKCGNEVKDPGEDCDGEDFGDPPVDCEDLDFIGGELDCHSNCTYNTQNCSNYNPDGTYTIIPVPTYYCAWGGVNFSLGTMVFSDTGSALNVSNTDSDPAPCTMFGPSAEVTRHIDVTCTIPGGCNERYSLVGDFVTDTQWTGTFTAEYFPPGPMTCGDCPALVSWDITGTK